MHHTIPHQLCRCEVKDVHHTIPHQLCRCEVKDVHHTIPHQLCRCEVKDVHHTIPHQLCKCEVKDVHHTIPHHLCRCEAKDVYHTIPHQLCRCEAKDVHHTIPHQLCRCEAKDVHGSQSFVSTHSEESDSLLFILCLQQQKLLTSAFLKENSAISLEECVLVFQVFTTAVRRSRVEDGATGPPVSGVTVSPWSVSHTASVA